VPINHYETDFNEAFDAANRPVKYDVTWRATRWPYRSRASESTHSSIVVKITLASATGARLVGSNSTRTISLLWFGKRSRRNKLVNMEQTVTVGASVIQPAAAVRDLGVLVDQELSMTQHNAKVTSSCFY